MSRKLSSMLTVLSSVPLPRFAFVSGDPGWMRTARAIPKQALKNDVRTKYVKVRKAIRPLSLAFKPAEPGIFKKNLRSHFL